MTTRRVISHLAVLILAMVAVGLTGADGWQCIPVAPQEPVDCATVDCAAFPQGLQCAPDSDDPYCLCCEAPGVTLTTDAPAYPEGATVHFVLDPGGAAIEHGASMGVPWWIERRAPDGGWSPVQAIMPFGCYPTDCVDGFPIEMCVDPAPPWCEELTEPFEGLWNGRIWVEEGFECGGTVVPTWGSVPAPAGEYRMGYGYRYDEQPGYVNEMTCQPADQTAWAYFEIVGPQVTLTTSREVYASGESVVFTMNPEGIPIEIGDDLGQAPWYIEQEQPDGSWVRVQARYPLGCDYDGCVDGMPMFVCADPGPPWCEERTAAFDTSWNGRIFVLDPVLCGGDTYEQWISIPALPGGYRVIYPFRYDDAPGVFDESTCRPADQTVMAYFFIDIP